MTLSGAPCWAVIVTTDAAAKGESHSAEPALSRSLYGVDGKPCIELVLQEARRAQLVTELRVLSNDPEVAQVARAAGVHVRGWQAPNLARAEGGLSLVRAVATALQAEPQPPGRVVVLAADAPLLRAADLDAILALLERSKAPWAFGAVPVEGSLWLGTDAGSRAISSAGALHYADNGVLYAAVLERLAEAAPGEAALYPLPAPRALRLRSSLDVRCAQWYRAAQASAPPLRRALGAESLTDALPLEPAALVMDFDGVFTDNRVLVLEDGTEGVWCQRGDGLGLELLRRRGFPLLVISKEHNPVVAARCRKVQVEYRQGVDDKLTLLRAWCSERDLPLERVIYIGNDVNDLECLEAVGCGIVPRDAYPSARRVARWALDQDGGAGALRALCDAVLERLGCGAP